MIRLDQVSYTYANSISPVIKNITLNVEAGEKLVVLGKNGSGKSTLARLMNASLVPDTGNLTVNGLNSRQAENRRIIRQQVSLLGAMPDHGFVSNLVEEDIAFGPENLGLPPSDIRKRVDTALNLVSMEDYATYPPYLLSGGQKQRIALAGMLAMQPAGMIIDESLDMLSRRGRSEMINLLVKISREQATTLVLITQSIEDIWWADRVAVLEQGEIKLLTTPRQLLLQLQLIEEMGLQLPEITRIIQSINQMAGTTIPADITELNTLVEILCPLL
ncbi:MAG: ATP-binding cassette domain-containing protein [Syntrophomonadaceae bacterium]|nr:ATP-binding cassette domain-containing protein [Syntrophomonadaceae bacterium]